MTSTDTAEPAVDDVTAIDVDRAEQEASEAAALVDALEERVRDGDDTISPDEIEQAKKLGAFARLRVEATRRKADRAAAAAHRRALAELRAQLLDDATGGPARLAEIAAALTGVDKAIAEFVDAAERHNTWHAETRERLRTLTEEPGHNVKGLDEESGLAFADRRSPRDLAVIVVDGQAVEEVEPGMLLAASVFQAADRSTDGLPMWAGHENLRTVLATTMRPAEEYAHFRERLETGAAPAKPGQRMRTMAEGQGPAGIDLDLFRNGDRFEEAEVGGVAIRRNIETGKSRRVQ